MIIVLDPGHGPGRADNRGALVGNEGDNNWKYCQALKTELEKYQDVKVSLTKTEKEDPELQLRGARAKGADLFLSCHSNAFSDSKVRGVEIFDSVAKPNKILAQKLVNELAGVMKTPNRGVKSKTLNNGQDWYGVLRASLAKSSMLIEHGFHTNMQDANTYVNQRQNIAQATAKVIADHYALKLKPTTQTYDGLYRVQVGAFKNYDNAFKLATELKAKGYDAFIK